MIKLTINKHYSLHISFNIDFKMKETKTTLFAIFKKGNHLGNERAKTKEEALTKYLITSKYRSFIDDKEFLTNYSLSVAKKGVHYY